MKNVQDGGIVQAVIETEQRWERFVINADEDPQNRAFVLDSWKRCREEGMDPHLNAAAKVAKESEVQELWNRHLLHETLLPYIFSLSDTMLPSRHLVVFADAQGLLLTVAGHTSVQSAAEKMNFVPGSRWLEKDAGTNAIGTALVLGAPVQIFAAEHYCAPVHGWTCSAAPITDPATHQILGVIDLTGMRNYHHPHSLAVVQSIARAVEDRLRDGLELERFTIFGKYLELYARHPDITLIALDRGGQVIRSSTGVWDQGWIDANNQLKHLPPGYRQMEDGTVWEVSGLHERWQWVLHHCHRQQNRIGSVIQALPVQTLHGKTASMGIRGKRSKEETPMALASFTHLVGTAPNFTRMIDQAKKVSRYDSPVLLLGETGTGKELLAQAIHRSSHHATGPFVAVNCGAIPAELIGSELFGFEGGSFTGAAREGRAGKFEAAEGGTIFLDEIGELPVSMQPYLLRVLDTGEVTRIGGQGAVHVSVRVIAATNQHLEEMVAAGTFRQDLFYRLNVVPIVLPPVRERPGDGIQILEHFLLRLAQQNGERVPAISPAVAALFEHYPWKGNVREIRNLAERLMASGPHKSAITVEDLPTSMQEMEHTARRVNPETLKQQENARIWHVLNDCGGNITQASRRLGIHRSTLYRKLARKNL